MTHNITENPTQTTTYTGAQIGSHNGSNGSHTANVGNINNNAEDVTKTICIVGCSLTGVMLANTLLSKGVKNIIIIESATEEQLTKNNDRTVTISHNTVRVLEEAGVLRNPEVLDTFEELNQRKNNIKKNEAGQNQAETCKAGQINVCGRSEQGLCEGDFTNSTNADSTNENTALQNENYGTIKEIKVYDNSNQPAMTLTIDEVNANIRQSNALHNEKMKPENNTVRMSITERILNALQSDAKSDSKSNYSRDYSNSCEDNCGDGYGYGYCDDLIIESGLNSSSKGSANVCGGLSVDEVNCVKGCEFGESVNANVDSEVDSFGKVFYNSELISLGIKNIREKNSHNCQIVFGASISSIKNTKDGAIVMMNDKSDEIQSSQNKNTFNTDEINKSALYCSESGINKPESIEQVTELQEEEHKATQLDRKERLENKQDARFLNENELCRNVHKNELLEDELGNRLQKNKLSDSKLNENVSINNATDSCIKDTVIASKAFNINMHNINDTNNSENIIDIGNISNTSGTSCSNLVDTCNINNIVNNLGVGESGGTVCSDDTVCNAGNDNGGNENMPINIRKIDCEMVFMACGSRSPLLQKMPFKFNSHNYNQTAIMCTLTHQFNHNHCAVESFIPCGAIAMLPLQNQRQSSMVFITETDQAEALMKMPQREMKDVIKHYMPPLYGDISISSKPLSFGLAMHNATDIKHGNIYLLGHSMRAIHPLAGQGFNLITRDIEFVSNTIAKQFINNEAINEYANDSISCSLNGLLTSALNGSLSGLLSRSIKGILNKSPIQPLKKSLKKSARKSLNISDIQWLKHRSADNALMMMSMQILIESFGVKPFGVMGKLFTKMRTICMMAIDITPYLKQNLSKYAMGNHIINKLWR